MSCESNGRVALHSLVVVIFLLAACSTSFAEEVKKLTREDGKKLPSGKTPPAVKLHLDDSVIVTLGQHPGLGLRWVESDESSKLLEVKTKKIAPNKTSNPNGVGGSVEDAIFTFRFKADAAKTAASTHEPQYLRLKLVRGRSTKAIETFEVPIQVVK